MASTQNYLTYESIAAAHPQWISSPSDFVCTCVGAYIRVHAGSSALCWTRFNFIAESASPGAYCQMMIRQSPDGVHFASGADAPMSRTSDTPASAAESWLTQSRDDSRMPVRWAIHAGDGWMMFGGRDLDAPELMHVSFLDGKAGILDWPAAIGLLPMCMIEMMRQSWPVPPIRDIPATPLFHSLDHRSSISQSYLGEITPAS